MNPLRDDERQSFMRRIIERPGDDLPRLIYADRLDEAGECDRAEFVRVQCELAVLRDAGCHEGRTCNVTGQCSECNRDVQAEPLRRRERELRHAHSSAWMAKLSGLGLLGWTFRRGFVEVVRCTAAEWLRHRDALRAATPLAEAVLTDVVPFNTAAERFAIPVLGESANDFLRDAVSDYLDGRERTPEPLHRELALCRGRDGHWYDGPTRVTLAGRQPARATPELLGDSALDLEGWLAREAQRRLGRSLERQFLVTARLMP